MMSTLSEEGSLRSGNTGSGRRKTESGRLRVIIITLSVVLILVLIGGTSYFVKIYGFDKINNGSDYKTPDKEFFEEKPKICETEGCKKAGKYFLKSMNLSADPCNDFFNYVCGNLEEEYEELFPQMALMTEVELIVRRQLINLLRSKNNSHRSFVEESKTFFQRCLKMNRATELEGMRKVVRDFGGFPLFDKSTYNRSVPWYVRAGTFIRQFGKYDRTLFNGFAQGIILNFEISANDGLSFTKPQSFFLYDHIANKADVKDQICHFWRNSCTKDEKFELENNILKMIQFQIKMAKCVKKGAPVYWKKSVNIRDIDRQFPVLHISDFFNEFFYVANFSTIRITADEHQYFEDISRVIKTTPPDVIDNFLGWSLFTVLGYRTLPPRRKNETTLHFFNDENEDKRAKQLEKFCFERVKYPYRFALSRMFVDNFFSDEMKAQAISLIEDVRRALVQMIFNTAWLSDVTKKQLANKITITTRDVGYPNWLKMNDKFDRRFVIRENITKPSVIEMMRTVNSFHVGDTLIRVQHPEMKSTGWGGLSPFEINAFYTPSDNEIIIPAGILQSPYFFPYATKSVLYGSGWVIGHEFSHAIDSNGLQFDPYGNRIGFPFTETEEATLEKKMSCVIQQFNSTKEPLTNRNLDGEKTLGENIADFVGLRALYKAYLISGAVDERLPGLEKITDKQLFFIAAGNCYCGFYTKELMHRQIDSDNHSPNNYRVFMPPSNIEEFSQAFGCKAGTVMNRTEKCVVW